MEEGEISDDDGGAEDESEVALVKSAEVVAVPEVVDVSEVVTASEVVAVPPQLNSQMGRAIKWRKNRSETSYVFGCFQQLQQRTMGKRDVIMLLCQNGNLSSMKALCVAVVKMVRYLPEEKVLQQVTESSAKLIYLILNFGNYWIKTALE